MKLLNDFYEILCTDTANGNIRFKVRMNKEHRIYKVHFPDNPVTPGVCLVQMATELLQKANEQRMELSDIPKIKFWNAVKPCDEPWFEFSNIVRNGKECRVRVSIVAEGKDYVRMTLNYKTCE